MFIKVDLTEPGREAYDQSVVKVVSYTRVSTGKQERGLGLSVQEQAIRGWAGAERQQIVAGFSDRVSGAVPVHERPGLAAALRLIREGEAEAIVVYRLDRLARDLIVQEQLVAEIRRMGGQLFTTSPAEAHYLDDDPDDPSRKLIRQVLGAVREFESSMILLRLRNGRRAKH